MRDLYKCRAVLKTNAEVWLLQSQCLSVHPAALSLKGAPSICVNPWAAGDTAGNKHYHCLELLDIDTASPTPTKPVTADWQRKWGWGGRMDCGGKGKRSENEGGDNREGG